MKKIFTFLKVWGNDYTVFIYILKILGGSLTMTYYILSFFDKEKTKKFNRKKNFFVLQRNKLIEAWNEPSNTEFLKKFLRGDRYQFKDIFLPKIENTYLMRTVYEDSLKVYTELNDNYSYAVIDNLEKKLPEGTYCYLGKNGEDITIKSGSTVVDAGEGRREAEGQAVRPASLSAALESNAHRAVCCELYALTGGRGHWSGCARTGDGLPRYAAMDVGPNQAARRRARKAAK
jgi:hypothetical protein